MTQPRTQVNLRPEGNSSQYATSPTRSITRSIRAKTFGSQFHIQPSFHGILFVRIYVDAHTLDLPVETHVIYGLDHKLASA